MSNKKHIVKTVFDEPVNFEKGSLVFNAEGTSNGIVRFNGVEFDAIEVWDMYAEGTIPTACTNKCCVAKTDKEKHNIVGAHVLIHKSEGDIQSGQTCYIIPLCNSCNVSGPDAYIELRRDIEAIKLKW